MVMTMNSMASKKAQRDYKGPVKIVVAEPCLLKDFGSEAAICRHADIGEEVEVSSSDAHEICNALRAHYLDRTHDRSGGLLTINDDKRKQMATRIRQLEDRRVRQANQAAVENPASMIEAMTAAIAAAIDRASDKKR